MFHSTWTADHLHPSMTASPTTDDPRQHASSIHILDGEDGESDSPILSGAGTKATSSSLVDMEFMTKATAAAATAASGGGDSDRSRPNSIANGIFLSLPATASGSSTAATCVTPIAGVPSSPLDGAGTLQGGIVAPVPLVLSIPALDSQSQLPSRTLTPMVGMTDTPFFAPLTSSPTMEDRRIRGMVLRLAQACRFLSHIPLNDMEEFHLASGVAPRMLRAAVMQTLQQQKALRLSSPDNVSMAIDGNIAAIAGSPPPTVNNTDGTIVSLDQQTEADHSAQGNADDNKGLAQAPFDTRNGTGTDTATDAGVGTATATGAGAGTGTDADAAATTTDTAIDIAIGTGTGAATTSSETTLASSIVQHEPDSTLDLASKDKASGKTSLNVSFVADSNALGAPNQSANGNTGDGNDDDTTVKAQHDHNISHTTTDLQNTCTVVPPPKRSMDHAWESSLLKQDIVGSRMYTAASVMGSPFFLSSIIAPSTALKTQRNAVQSACILEADMSIPGSRPYGKGMSFAGLMHPNADSSYDPMAIDNIKSARHRVVMNLPGYMSSIISYVKPKDLKKELNTQFRLKYPHMPPLLTLSKIRKVKRLMVDVAIEVKMELSTVAYAYIYFEKLVLHNVVTKANRKVVGASCLLVAYKYNNSFGTDKQLIRRLLHTIEDHFDVKRTDVIRSEFGVFANLNFGLAVPNDNVRVHYNKLLETLDVSDYAHWAAL
jgi:Cyclin, N-terminal domain